MSDDAPRSTQGNRPDQRRGRDAPVWWDQLQRSDLPDDAAGGAGRLAERTHTEDGTGWPVSSLLSRASARSRRWSVALSLVAAVVVALAVSVAVWAATSGTGRNTAMTAAVVVGVPVALLVASLLGNMVTRRMRRR